MFAFAFAILFFAGRASAEDDCVHVGTQICNRDPLCATFGVYKSLIQFHGCNATVANMDWTIYAKTPGAASYTKLPGHVNINNAECAHHPKVGTASCAGPTPSPKSPTPAPPPTPPPHLYEVEGSIDVGTLENSMFYWKGVMYLLENLGCGYIDHAGNWFPEFKGYIYMCVCV